MKVLQILVLMVGLTVFANAQEKVILLSGTVYDSDKKVLPLTAVTIISSSKHIFKTISDEKGFYRVQLPIGKYQVEFRKYGFKRATITDFENFEGIGKTLDINMEQGYCNDCSGDPYSDEIENIRKSDEVDFLKPKEKIGFLKGEIIDEFGAALPDLVIKFVNNIGEEFQSLTDGNGKFSVKLPYGNYKILAGFQGLLINKKQEIKINKFENKTEKIVLSYKYKDKKKCFVS